MNINEQIRHDDAIVASWAEIAIKRGFMRTCLNCEKFDENTEVCAQFKERPPARVIVLGCDAYFHDVPF